MIRMYVDGLIWTADEKIIKDILEVHMGTMEVRVLELPKFHFLLEKSDLSQFDCSLWCTLTLRGVRSSYPINIQGPRQIEGI
jgi:hypothetical protein